MFKLPITLWSNDPSSDFWRDCADSLLYDDEEIQDPEDLDYLVGAYIECDYEDLQNELTQTEGDIVVFCEAGLWDGPKDMLFQTHSNHLKTCFEPMERSEEYHTYWVNEDGDLCRTGIHHDGTNSYLFRSWVPNLDEEICELGIHNLNEGHLSLDDFKRLFTVPLGEEVLCSLGYVA